MSVPPVHERGQKVDRRINLRTRSKAKQDLGTHRFTDEIQTPSRNADPNQEYSGNPSKVTADIVFADGSHPSTVRCNLPEDGIPETQPNTRSPPVHIRKWAQHPHVSSFAQIVESSSDDEDGLRRHTKFGRKNLLQVGSTSELLNFVHFLFGISKPDLFANHPGSRVIHPASPFMAGPFVRFPGRKTGFNRGRERGSDGGRNGLSGRASGRSEQDGVTGRRSDATAAVADMLGELTVRGRGIWENGRTDRV